MFLLALCILILKLKPSISHFPQHRDLQKVGEVIFNNEKYNILKVTTHTVTDYFEDFMLGKKRPNPTKRLFVDDNSFRHQWSGFNEKPQSLRKTEIIKHTFDEVVTDNISNEKNNSSMLPNNNEKENEKKTASNTSIVNIANSSSNSVENVNSNGNSLEDTNVASSMESKENEKSAESNISTANKANSSSNSVENADNNENSLEDTNASTVKEDVSEVKYSSKPSTVKPRNNEEKAQAHKKKLFGSSEVKLRQGQPAKSPDNERTVVQTTFFCPFFGIITMSAFVD